MNSYFARSIVVCKLAVQHSASPISSLISTYLKKKVSLSKMGKFFKKNYGKPCLLAIFILTQRQSLLNIFLLRLNYIIC